MAETAAPDSEINRPHSDEHVTGDDPTHLSAPSSKLPFFLPPLQRQKWGDTQILPHVNWGDLFFDLFYVAGAYNLGGIILEDPSFEGFLYFLGAFFPILHMWLDKMFFDARFATEDDIWHRGFEVAVLICVATAVLHIRPVDTMSNPSDEVAMFAFSLACFLGSFLCFTRYLEVFFWGVGQPVIKVAARRDASIKMVYLVFSGVAAIVSGIEYFGTSDETAASDYRTSDYGDKSNSDYKTSEHGDKRYRLLASEPYEKTSATDTTNVPILLCLMGPIVGFLCQVMVYFFLLPGNGGHKKYTVPMNIDFSIHRLGEWTMLMLGESILSLLIVDTSKDVDYYITFYAGILSVVLLQYLHFRSQPHHADEHAMRRSKAGGFIFTLTNQIYSAALIVIGVSYKLVLYEYTYEDGSSRRLMVRDAMGRILAGGGASKYEKDDRQQRIANFFCFSMAIVWASSDIMLLAHKGIHANFERCRCKITKKLSICRFFLVMLRLGLIVFMATLSLYETDPERTALIGLGGICAQVALRVIGDLYFPSYKIRHAGEDSEDDKWPNVTHARAEPGKEDDIPDGP